MRLCLWLRGEVRAVVEVALLHALCHRRLRDGPHHLMQG